MSDTNTAPATLWTWHGAGALTPYEVATLFAAWFFADGPRRVDTAHCTGQSIPDGWTGTFRLEGGRHVYGLAHAGDGPWRVWLHTNGVAP